MQALEPPRIRAAADPELERRPFVAAGAAAGKRLSDLTLLLGCAVEIGGELGVALHFLAPALDAARRLEP